MDAVQSEPVSGRNSLLTGNLQGIFAVFRRFGLFLGDFTDFSGVITMCYGAIPCSSKNREFIARNREIIRKNREEN